jgi:hypothetical protein
MYSHAFSLVLLAFSWGGAIVFYAEVRILLCIDPVCCRKAKLMLADRRRVCVFVGVTETTSIALGG